MITPWVMSDFNGVFPYLVSPIGHDGQVKDALLARLGIATCPAEMPAIEEVRSVTFGDESANVAEQILAEVEAGSKTVSTMLLP